MLETRIETGLRHWPDLAAAAGLPPDGWSAQLLGSRQDDRGDRVVLALSHPDHPPVVCKQGISSSDIASTVGAIVAQSRAYYLLAQHPTARVPRILAALPDRGAIVMELVPGTQLEEQVLANVIDTPVSRAGHWAHAFHSAGPVEARAFQPRFVLNHLTQAAGNIRAGRRKIARAGRFVACVDQLAKQAKAVQGKPTRASLRHGDLNARNLMLAPDDDRVWAVDFLDAGVRPVGFDIARLLVSLAEAAPIEPAGQVIPDRIRDAFFTGYGLVGIDDASVPFLCHARLLSNWLGLPHAEHKMTIPQTIRFQRILALAEAGILQSR